MKAETATSATRQRGCCWALALAALGLSAAAPQQSEPKSEHRFALLVGNPEGGIGTRPLHYAARDAQRVDDILTRLGGVLPGDAELLIGKGAREVRQALLSLSDRAASARERGERTLLIFYYSGHSKDGELRLGDSRLPLTELRQLLALAPADVRLGLIDSCQSGAITRSKGVRPVPAFDVRGDAAAGESPRGLVLIASSAADEESQESDSVDGSFFTHYLASGLLGDADADGDGRVTLAEAYAYTFGHTVGSTVQTQAGAQHPVYLYDLGGSSDLVLTQLTPRGALIFPGPSAGDYLVLDGRREAVAEVIKIAGVERSLALAPGHYTLKKPVADYLLVGEVEVGESQLQVDDSRLQRVARDRDPQKGASGPAFALAASIGYQGFFAAANDSGLFPPAGLGGISLVAHQDLGHQLSWGLDLAAGGGSTTLSLPGLPPIGTTFEEFSGGAALAWDLQLTPWLRLSPGPRLAFLFLTRQFAGHPELTNQSFFTLTPGLQLEAAVPLGSSFEVFGRGRLNYLFYNVDNDRSLGYAEASLGIAYVFGN